MPKGVKTELTPEQSAAKKAEAEANRVANFDRLAEARMNTALDKIALISNLASPSYSYTPEKIKVMYDAMVKEVNGVFSRFQPKASAAVEKRFTLSKSDDAGVADNNDKSDDAGVAYNNDVNKEAAE